MFNCGHEFTAKQANVKPVMNASNPALCPQDLFRSHDSLTESRDCFAGLHDDDRLALATASSCLNSSERGWSKWVGPTGGGEGLPA